MSTLAPAAKVWAAAVAAFLAPIALWGLAKLGVPLPVEAGDLLRQIIEGAVCGLLAFGAGWVKAPAARDTVKQG